MHSLNTPTDSYLFIEHLYEQALTCGPARLTTDRAEYLLERCLQRLDDGQPLAGPDYRELWGYAHAG